MNILEGILHKGGRHQQIRRILDDDGTDGLFLKIPSGGLLTRFYYSKGISWQIVMGALEQAGGVYDMI